MSTIKVPFTLSSDEREQIRVQVLAPSADALIRRDELIEMLRAYEATVKELERAFPKACQCVSNLKPSC